VQRFAISIGPEGAMAIDERKLLRRATLRLRGMDRSEVSFARRWAYGRSSFEYQRDGGSKMFRTLEPTVPLAFSDRSSI